LAMVEFATKEAAMAAKKTLHGCNIYPNMCTLRTEFTDKEKLQVNENSLNDRWDFTVSGPPDVGFPRSFNVLPMMGGDSEGLAMRSNYGIMPQRHTRKYLLDFPDARPWKEKTESPDKITQELSENIFTDGQVRLLRLQWAPSVCFVVSIRTNDKLSFAQ
jgi:hypothetical protein